MANNTVDNRNSLIILLRDKIQYVYNELNHYRAGWVSSFHKDEYELYLSRQMFKVLPEVFLSLDATKAQVNQILKTGSIGMVSLTISSYLFNVKNDYIAKKHPSKAKVDSINQRYNEFQEDINTFVDPIFKNDSERDAKKDPTYIACNSMIKMLAAADSYNKSCNLTARTNLNYLTKLFAAYSVLNFYNDFDALEVFRRETLRSLTINHNIFKKFLNDNHPNGNEQQENNFKIILDRKKAVVNRIHYVYKFMSNHLIPEIGLEIIELVKTDKKVPLDLSNIKAIGEIVKLIGQQNMTLPNAINHIYDKAKYDANYKAMVNIKSFDINLIEKKIMSIINNKNELVSENRNIEEEICKG